MIHSERVPQPVCGAVRCGAVRCCAVDASQSGTWLTKNMDFEMGSCAAFDLQLAFACINH